MRLALRHARSTRRRARRRPAVVVVLAPRPPPDAHAQPASTRRSRAPSASASVVGEPEALHVALGRRDAHARHTRLAELLGAQVGAQDDLTPPFGFQISVWVSRFVPYAPPARALRSHARRRGTRKLCTRGRSKPRSSCALASRRLRRPISSLARARGSHTNKTPHEVYGRTQHTRRTMHACVQGVPRSASQHAATFPLAARPSARTGERARAGAQRSRARARPPFPSCASPAHRASGERGPGGADAARRRATPRRPGRDDPPTALGSRALVQGKTRRGRAEFLARSRQARGASARFRSRSSSTGSCRGARVGLDVGASTKAPAVPTQPGPASIDGATDRGRREALASNVLAGHRLGETLHRRGRPDGGGPLGCGEPPGTVASCSASSATSEPRRSPTPRRGRATRSWDWRPPELPSIAGCPGFFAGVEQQLPAPRLACSGT